MDALSKMKKLKDYFAERKYFFIVLYWVIWAGWYFLLNNFMKDPHLIHMALDDQIPFIEYFVVPYVIWFGYIVFAHLWTFFTSKRDFLVMACLIGLSELFSLIVLTAYPTMHDLRPDPSTVRDNPFTSLVFALYGTENPYCIFPSEHCMLAIVITVGLLTSERFKGKLWPKIVFPVYTVLVMLSTVFIKQHSIADVYLAMGMCVPVCLLTYFVICPKRRFEPKADAAPSELSPEPALAVASAEEGALSVAADAAEPFTEDPAFSDAVVTEDPTLSDPSPADGEADA